MTAIPGLSFWPFRGPAGTGADYRADVDILLHLPYFTCAAATVPINATSCSSTRCA